MFRRIFDCVVFTALVGALSVAGGLPAFAKKDDHEKGKGQHTRHNDDRHQDRKHQGRHFSDRDRIIVHDYYQDEFRRGKCQPGLSHRLAIKCEIEQNGSTGRYCHSCFIGRADRSSPSWPGMKHIKISDPIGQPRGVGKDRVAGSADRDVWSSAGCAAEYVIDVGARDTCPGEIDSRGSPAGGRTATLQVVHAFRKDSSAQHDDRETAQARHDKPGADRGPVVERGADFAVGRNSSEEV